MTSVRLAIPLGDGGRKLAFKPESLECSRPYEVIGWKTRRGAFPIPLHTSRLAPRTSHFAPRTWHLAPRTSHLALRTSHFECLLPGALGHRMSYKGRSSISSLHLPLINTSHLTTRCRTYSPTVRSMAHAEGSMDDSGNCYSITPPFDGIDSFNLQLPYVPISTENDQLQAVSLDNYCMTDERPYVFPIPSLCADVLLLGNELNDDRDDGGTRLPPRTHSVIGGR